MGAIALRKLKDCQQDQLVNHSIDWFFFLNWIYLIMNIYMENIELNVRLPFNQLLEAVKKLSTKEKLLLNDAIWGESIDIPKEQQELVRKRKKTAIDNPAEMLDWEEASKSLKS